MKLQVAALLVAMLVAVAVAEPPRRSPVWGARLRVLQRQEVEAPYPPSGWRPETPFYLPGEGGDAGAEGETTTAAPEEATTTEAAPEVTTTEAAPEGDNDGAEARDNDAEYDAEPEPAPANIPAGVYYVLLPDGRLQRVNYQVEAPAAPVSGNYVIQEVSPFSSPFYAYQQPRFVQILKK